MKPIQFFEELNETISSLSLNEEMAGNLNQYVFVENQETEGFKNVTIQSASTLNLSKKSIEDKNPRSNNGCTPLYTAAYLSFQ